MRAIYLLFLALLFTNVHSLPQYSIPESDSSSSSDSGSGSISGSGSSAPASSAPVPSSAASSTSQPSSTSAPSLGLSDTASSISCGAEGSACCEPSCTAYIYNVGGCVGGDVAWSGNCQMNYDNPQGSQGIGDYNSCSGFSMSWGSSNGQVQVTVTGPSGTETVFDISGCDVASEGGGQCVPGGGGCTATLVQ